MQTDGTAMTHEAFAQEVADFLEMHWPNVRVRVMNGADPSYVGIRAEITFAAIVGDIAVEMIEDGPVRPLLAEAIAGQLEQALNEALR